MAVKSFSFLKPEDSPGFLLWQTTITWQRLIKSALDSYDISHAQFVILALLLWLEEAEQAIIQNEIVSRTRLDKMTVSKALKKLALKNLVERNEHPTDTRAKSMTLTAKGRALVKKLVMQVENIDHQFFGHIPKKDQRMLLQFLRLLSHPDNDFVAPTLLK